MPSRALLVQELDKYFKAEDYNNKKCSLVCIHVNNFHGINYMLGHEVGDGLLSKITNELNIEVKQ